MKRALHENNCKRILLALLAAAVLLGVLLARGTAQAAGETLRVGYTDSDGIVPDRKGELTGYAVDYLAALSKITGWTYEYICDSKTNCLDALEAGELDMVVMTYSNKERSQRFAFSYLAMAHGHTDLYARVDSDFCYQEYAAFDGCRVGVPENTNAEDSFLSYAEEMGLDYELVPYPDEAACREGLLAGEVDLMTSSSFSVLADVKLVDRFLPERAYLVVGKEETELLDQVDDAMEQLCIQQPDLQTALMETYYSADENVTALYLTREEREYLNTVGPIVVKGYDNRQPMGYTDGNGQFMGVLVDYLDRLAAFSGLEFIYEPAEFSSLEENANAMAQEDYCLLYMDQDLEALGLNGTLYKSDALFQTALAYIKKKEEQVSKWGAHTFAINGEMEYLEELLLETNENSNVLCYDTSEECMESLYRGEADMTILEEHVATYFLQKPKYADTLMQVPGSGAYADGVCLYAPEEHALLVSILNKTLEHMSESQRLYIITNSANAHGYQYQVEDMMYEYGAFILVCTVSLLVIVLLMGMLHARILRLRNQKKENEALQERIQLDELTGVYNRPFFFEKAEDMILHGGNDLYLVRLNVCHFKVVNELYGTERGDRLLEAIGAGLMDLSRREHFLAGRFTADHFFLCIPRETFERVNFARRVKVSWLGMDVTLTYGVYPVEDQKDIPVSAMCDRANMAVAYSEQMTSEYIFYYSDQSRQQLLREREIEAEMDQALEDREFCIYIQPKYDAATDRIVGGEALVRWEHPWKGMIPPGMFIGLFERNGFILKLDYYVWEESCRFLAEAKKKGLTTCPISINISRVHFYGTDLSDKLMGLLEKYSLQPWELELEITESICGEEPEVIFGQCEELRRLGFRVAMDDFGSGYSSLHMLKRMPLDIIKMDLKFLSTDEDRDQAEKGRNILGTMVELAQTLGFQVVVEGVETQEQRDFIRSIGGCVIQGYFYSRPVDTETYEKMLAEQ